MKDVFGMLVMATVIGFSFTACEKAEEDDETEDLIEDKEQQGGDMFDVAGVYEMDYGPYDIAMKDDYVFACRDDKIYVIDVSNVSDPEKVATYDDVERSNKFEALLVSGNTLYAGCTQSTGVYAIDVSSPSAPVLSGKYIDTIYSGNSLKALSLFVNGTTLYAGGSNGTGALLVKFDVSGASSISVQDYWQSTGSGNAIGGVWANSSYVFASTADGYILSFPVSGFGDEPAGEYTFQAEAGHEHWGRTIVGSGNTLYWADWGAGVAAIDISDPTNMSVLSIITHSTYTEQHSDAEGTNAYDLVIDEANSDIYVANGWSGLLKISTDEASRVEAFVDYKDHQYRCIALYGNYVIVGDIAAGTTDVKGLKIIKI